MAIFATTLEPQKALHLLNIRAFRRTSPDVAAGAMLPAQAGDGLHRIWRSAPA